MRLPAPLWVILALFLVAATLFNLNTPYRESGVIRYQRNAPAADIGAPDELQHANYVAHLKSGKGFPVLDPSQPDFGENYQSHQPPLYYLLAAGWSTLTVADPQDPEAGVRLRFLNTLIGLGTILGTFFLARWGLGRDDVGLAAAAFVAFLPMNLALHGAVSNDPLLYALITWATALAAKGVQHGWDNKTAALVGVLTGLALLTKTTALALFPVLIVGVAVSYKFAQDRPKPTPAQLALCLALPLVLAAPWLLRNQNLYGDPFALKAFNEAFTGNPKAEMFINEIGPVAYFSDWVVWWTARSFIGVFGYMDIFLFETLRPDQAGALYTALIFIILLVIALGAAPFAKVKTYTEELELPDPRKYHILGTTLLIVVTLLFVRFNLTYFQGQARYLYPAIAPLAILFGNGLANLAILRAESVRTVNLTNLWLVAAVPLLLLDFLSLQTIIQAFPLRLNP